MGLILKMIRTTVRRNYLKLLEETFLKACALQKLGTEVEYIIEVKLFNVSDCSL